MKNLKYIGVVTLCLFLIPDSFAQQDTLSRSVTVEREFQPVIQSAGKPNVSPKRLEVQEPPVELVYSDYSAVSGSFFNAKPMRFPSKPFPEQKQPDGILEAGLGYFNSHLDFRYRVPVSGKASKGVILNLFANHDAQWGVCTWEETAVGMDFVKQFSDLDVYFDVVGKNHFFTRFGRYFAGDNKLSISRFTDLAPNDKQSIWTAAANVGVRSKKTADIQYKVQTGYQAYILPSQVAEHQINTLGSIEWNGEEHHAGADIVVRNAFSSVEDGLWLPTDTIRTNRSRHGIRIHPYYKYVGERVRVRVGANLDMNIGKGQMMSSNGQISFAPSPDVFVEYRIIPSWLAVYAGAEGQFGFGTLDDYMAYCPYRPASYSVTSTHVASYIPVDAYLGFKIRATDNLLLDVYAHYAYMKNQTITFADSLSNLPDGYLDYCYGDYQRWKVGLELTYHYQDIIRLLVSGNYYHWISEGIEAPENIPFSPKAVYDRPAWDVHVRVDAHIDSHWSLYSDNTIAGPINMMTWKGDQKGKVFVDLDLGARYDFNSDLGVYLQLDNFINRHNDRFYGYQREGIQVMAGCCWKF
ncbi:MAG: TonB-dependent receptor [Paludibacteraceae bacterium]|nr:TonB-dependent receptor [Paludibacteraceae bacterium]